ncbi:virion structural protein [Klebsiella phage vB_KpM_FBKp24]|uniref:Virion structural protein n=1 Tax=Klebsiella phage vB_KpM_FBKp24 TaxID=2801834 RepID=A0A7U0GBD9_9CAUD|nr:virion structural protein [Klebsiella phage vB_KpM_FBKp24]QQV92047.1 virion structural protein [Klebsiella phage vB_KpM_FBKp24]
MSLFNEEDDAPSQPLPQFKANKTPYRDVAIDTQYTPLSTILTTIEGKPWKVTWYSQILNGDNAPAGLQVSRLEINQQYKKINGLELKVTEAIQVSPEFRPETQEFTVRGGANMYPGVRPNIGDLFTATLLDGRVGIFQISQPPEQRSIYMQTTYRIEYVMRDFLDADYAKKLKDKTVEEYFFIPSFLDSGINPVISDSAHGDYRTLMDWRERIPLFYLNKFYDKEYATLTIPGQKRNIIYDPFLTTFVSALWSQENIGPFHGMAFLNVMDGTIREIKTVLDALLDQEDLLMDIVETKIPIVQSSLFLTDPFYRGPQYMGVPYVCFPNNSDRYRNGWEAKPKVISLIQGYRTRPRVRYTLDQYFPEDVLIPYSQGWNKGIKDVTIDDYYIFSEMFYGRRTESLSVLETLVWETLNHGQVSAQDLMALFNDSRNWDDLNQFYYLPILYALIPAALRGLS